MKHKTLLLATLFLATLLTAPAQAEIGSRSGYTYIEKGKFDVDWSSLFLMHYNAAPIKQADTEIGTTSRTNLAVLTGLTFRYFLIRNLGLSLTAGVNFQSTSFSTEFDDAANGTSSDSSVSDMGFPILLGASYYVGLNNNFFFVPSLSGGALLGGSRSIPDPADENKTISSSLLGFLGKIDLNFVFYASSNLNLRAGISGIFNAQTETIDGENGADPIETSETVFDAGFNIGIGYTF